MLEKRFPQLPVSGAVLACDGDLDLSIDEDGNGAFLGSTLGP